MGLAERFIAAARRLGRTADAGPALSADVLVRACRRVLPVDGAGLTLNDALLRLPLAATDPTTAGVEQLEATLCDGPGVDAITTGRALVAGPPTMTACWPAYTSRVFANTPFRSLAAVPLVVADGSVLGVLSLFARTPDLPRLINLDDLTREVADLTANILHAQVPGRAADRAAEIDQWPSEELTGRRQVWLAVAIIAGAANLSETTALTALRRHAQRHQLTLDQTAKHLIAQALHAH